MTLVSGVCGRYSSRRATASTRCVTSREMRGLLFSTRDTVAGETPASAAISLIPVFFMIVVI